MSTVIENITKVEDKVYETIAKVQSPVVDAVRTAVEKVEERVPELPASPVAGKIPSAHELLDSQFAFAQKLLDQQHDFLVALVEAARPVTTKLVVVEGEAAA